MPYNNILKMFRPIHSLLILNHTEHTEFSSYFCGRRRFTQIFFMHDILKPLGISEKNSGVSTGSNWIKSAGKVITSFSPVDGKKIGEVNAYDDQAYELMI